MTTWHPILIFLLGVVVALGILGLILWLLHERKRQSESQYLHRVTSVFMTERLRSEEILRNLDVGVVAYAPDGRLNLFNEAARDLLGMSPTDQLSELLDRWPALADVRAAFVLGAREAQATIDTPGRRVHLSFREARPDGMRLATIVLLRDVTLEEREERQRREFVANVSHELKTPITTIRSYTESLIDWGLEEKATDDVRNDLRRILDDAIRMERLVTDLLLLSTLDSQGRQLAMEEIDLRIMLRQLVDRFQMEADKKSITLTSEVREVPPIFAAYHSVERILSNLLSNALKYTDDHGRICIRTGVQMDRVIIEIEDSGRGIPEAEQPFIFDRFYRVDTTGSRKHGGTGLGLSIAKELVELHHGTIEVASVPGAGSTFTVTLPTAGHVYHDVWQRAGGRGKSLTDPLLKAASEELLKQAKDYGFEAEDLRDLDDEELKVVLAPYRASIRPNDTTES